MLYKFIAVIATLWGCSILWRMGGDGHVGWRSVGVPALISIVKFGLTLNPWTLLYSVLLFLMIRGFSYGLSSPPHKFWVWVFRYGRAGNFKEVEFATRATCSLFWALPAGLFAWFTGNWWVLGLYTLINVVLGGTVGAYEEDVEVSERLIGLLVGFAILV